MKSYWGNATSIAFTSAQDEAIARMLAFLEDN